MVREVKNLTNIKLTESDTDGTWLHFDGGGKACGIALSTILSHGNIANEAIEAWAREQLDREEIPYHRRYYLHPELDKDTLRELERLSAIIDGSTRPSPPMEVINDTSLSVPIVEPESYVSVTISIKEQAERRRIRELNGRLERLRNGSN